MAQDVAMNIIVEKIPLISWEYVILVILLIIVFISVLSLLRQLLRRKSQLRLSETDKKDHISLEEEVYFDEDIERHLKEDELQIVNILKLKEGKCNQGMLELISGFSKAQTSRILKELKIRNIITVKIEKKKNMIYLCN